MRSQNLRLHFSLTFFQILIANIRGIAQNQIVLFLAENTIIEVEKVFGAYFDLFKFRIPITNFLGFVRFDFNSC